MLATADTPARADDGLLTRIRAEFCEMPGLRLTPVQARRLWALDAQVCDGILRALVRDGFLRRTSDGSFLRADLP
jgi:hypothetical protein